MEIFYLPNPTLYYLLNPKSKPIKTSNARTEIESQLVGANHETGRPFPVEIMPILGP